MYIAIIGGGPAGQAAALNLTESGDNTVVIFRRGDQERLENPVLTMQDLDGKVITSNPIPTLYYTNDSDEVLGHELPEADVILLCTPVNACGSVLKRIEPFISRNKPVHVGTIYGQGFFNMICKRDGGFLAHLRDVETFSLAYIPWIVKCPDETTVKVASEEHYNLAYTTSKGRPLLLDLFQQLTFNNKIKPIFQFTQTEIETTLTSDNWLLHTPRLWDMNCNVVHIHPIPTFYDGYTEMGITVLHQIESEYEDLRIALKEHCSRSKNSLPFLRSFKEMEELPDSTGKSEPFTGFRDYFEENTTPNHLVPHLITPDGWQPDLSHRMYADDVLNGLSIIRALCKLLHVDCMHITQLYESLIEIMDTAAMYADPSIYQLVDWDKVTLDEFLLGNK